MNAHANAAAKAKPAPMPHGALGENDPLHAATQMYGTLLSNVARGQAELLRFLSARLAKDVQMLSLLAGCRTPADAAQLQLKVGADAAADYLDETQRMIALLEKAASENLALLR